LRIEQGRGSVSSPRRATFTTIGIIERHGALLVCRPDTRLCAPRLVRTPATAEFKLSRGQWILVVSGRQPRRRACYFAVPLAASGNGALAGRAVVLLLAHAQSDDAGCSLATHVSTLQHRAPAILTKGRDDYFVGLAREVIPGRIESSQVSRASRSGRTCRSDRARSTGLALRTRRANVARFAFGAGRAGRSCLAHLAGKSRGPHVATFALNSLRSGRTLNACFALRSSRSSGSRGSCRSLSTGRTLRTGDTLRSGRPRGTLLPRAGGQQQRERQENTK
jgi:hypothetical protein